MRKTKRAGTAAGSAGRKGSRAAQPLESATDESATDVPTTEVLCFRLVLILAQKLRYLMDQRLAGDGLTTQQAMMLGVVEHSNQAPSLADVGRVMATSYQNVKQLAVILERKGFVHLARDTNDRRVVRIQATAQSSRYWRQRDRNDFEWVGTLFTGLSHEERGSLLQALRLWATEVERSYRRQGNRSHSKMPRSD